MSHRATADLDRATDHGHRGDDVVWVTPGDVHTNRTVTIPDPSGVVGQVGLEPTTDGS